MTIKMESFDVEQDYIVKMCFKNDEERWFSFNPYDLLFYTRLKNFMSSFEEKKQNLKINGEAIPANLSASDDTEQGLAFFNVLEDLAEYCIGQVDMLLGHGTYKRVFGNEFDLLVFGKWLQFIYNRVSKVRFDKVESALKKKAAGKVMS